MSHIAGVDSRQMTMSIGCIEDEIPEDSPARLVLSRVMRKIVCRQPREALLCNGGIAESGLQMPHVHVLPVTPLGACDMAQAGAGAALGKRLSGRLPKRRRKSRGPRGAAGASGATAPRRKKALMPKSSFQT